MQLLPRPQLATQTATSKSLDGRRALAQSNHLYLELAAIAHAGCVSNDSRVLRGSGKVMSPVGWVYVSAEQDAASYHGIICHHEHWYDPFFRIHCAVKEGLHMLNWTYPVLILKRGVIANDLEAC